MNRIKRALHRWIYDIMEEIITIEVKVNCDLLEDDKLFKRINMIAVPQPGTYIDIDDTKNHFLFRVDRVVYVRSGACVKLHGMIVSAK